MISRKLFAAAVALTCVVPQTALSQDSGTYTVHGTNVTMNVHVQQTAGALLEKCDADLDNPTPELFICAGYLSGAQDAVDVLLASNFLPRAYCIPDSTPRGELLALFMNYAGENEERLRLPAALVMLQAFREAYPCVSEPDQGSASK